MPSAEAGDPDLPQLGLFDLLLPMTLPAHHHEIGGTGYLLDLIIRVAEVGTHPSRKGSPTVICEKGENEKREGAEECDRQDV